MSNEDFERYYFHLNDEGLLTVQLTNEPNKFCIQRTLETINEASLIRAHEAVKYQSEHPQIAKIHMNGICDRCGGEILDVYPAGQKHECTPRRPHE